MEIEICDPRVDPEPAGWRRFVKAAGLLPVWDHRLLGIEAWLARNPSLLATVRDGEGIAGAFVAMVCRSVRERAYARPPTRSDRGITPRWVEVYLPSLSGYPACVFLRRVTDERRRSAVRAFERAVAARLGPGLLGVVYRAMDPELGPVLGGRGRPAREIDPGTVLSGVDSEARWRDRLDPAVRERLDRVADDDTLRADTAAGRTDLDPIQLAALLNAHRARQDARAWREGQRSRFGGLRLDTRSRVAPAYLATLLARPDVLTTAYRERDGALAGFSVLLDHPDGAALQHFAARPDARPGLWLDACARAVRHVAENDRPALTAGRTLLDRKAALGFGTRPLVSVAVPRPLLGR